MLTATNWYSIQTIKNTMIKEKKKADSNARQSAMATDALVRSQSSAPYFKLGLSEFMDLSRRTVRRFAWALPWAASGVEASGVEAATSEVELDGTSILAELAPDLSSRIFGLRLCRKPPKWWPPKWEPPKWEPWALWALWALWVLWALWAAPKWEPTWEPPKWEPPCPPKCEPPCPPKCEPPCPPKWEPPNRELEEAPLWLLLWEEVVWLVTLDVETRDWESPDCPKCPKCPVWKMGLERDGAESRRTKSAGNKKSRRKSGRRMVGDAIVGQVCAPRWGRFTVFTL